MAERLKGSELTRTGRGSNVLAQREGIAPEFGKRVASAAIDLGSKDVRLAVRLARLSKNEDDPAKVVETLRRRR